MMKSTLKNYTSINDIDKKRFGTSIFLLCTWCTRTRTSIIFIRKIALIAKNKIQSIKYSVLDRSEREFSSKVIILLKDNTESYQLPILNCKRINKTLNLNSLIVFAICVNRVIEGFNLRAFNLS